MPKKNIRPKKPDIIKELEQMKGGDMDKAITTAARAMRPQKLGEAEGFFEIDSEKIEEGNYSEVDDLIGTINPLLERHGLKIDVEYWSDEQQPKDEWFAGQVRLLKKVI
jgi:hypothetical protein